MHELLLLQRARPAYRRSRWKTLIDDRAGALLARGYSPGTVGNYLCQWVDFVGEYEAEGDVLPQDVRSPEVAGYLNRHWTQPSHAYSHARVALRHLLHDDDEHVRRLRPRCRDVDHIRRDGVRRRHYSELCSASILSSAALADPSA